MYDVFICYVRTLERQVTALHDALERSLRTVHRREAQVFQDTSDLSSGDEWRLRIDKALAEASVMVVVVTPTLFESKECIREILAFHAKQHGVIIPLIVEDITGVEGVEFSIPKNREQNGGIDAASVLEILRSRNFEDFQDYIFADPTTERYLTRVTEIARAIRSQISRGASKSTLVTKNNGLRRLRSITVIAGLSSVLILGVAVFNDFHCALLGNSGLVCNGSHDDEWREIDAPSIVAREHGDFLVAPRDSAEPYWPIRRGNRYQGPIFENHATPGWFRLDVEGAPAYAPSDLFRTE